MKKIWIMFTLCLLITSGCQDFRMGWMMDYGTPSAQFLQEDLRAKGKPFLNQKITVKGTVSKKETGEQEKGWLHLGSGIQCQMKNLQMQECQPGDTVYVDGVLAGIESNKIILSPAMLRDPKAPFNPR